MPTGAGLSGAGTLAAGPSAFTPAAALSGEGTLSVSREEVEAVAVELGTAGPGYLEKLASQSPELWSRRDLIAAGSIIVAVVYCFVLPAAAQQDVVSLSIILTAIVTVMMLLRGGDT